MMKWPLLLFTILFSLFLFFLTPLFLVTGNDRENYLNLTESNPAPSQQFKQTRLGVSKTVFFSKNRTRLQSYLQAPHSEVVISQADEKEQLVEHLSSPCCWIQEKLYFSSDVLPMQQLHYLQSPKAILSYHSQSLFSSKASLSRYALRGHTLIFPAEEELPFMKGTADFISLKLGGGAIESHFEKLHLSLET